MEVKNKDYIIYIPSEITLKRESVPNSIFLGWETEKSEIFIVSAHNRSDERRIRSALDKLSSQIGSKGKHRAKITQIQSISVTNVLKNYLGGYDV